MKHGRFEIPNNTAAIKFYNDYAKQTQSRNSLDSSNMWGKSVSRSISDNYALQGLHSRMFNKSHNARQPNFSINTNKQSTVTGALGQMATWNVHRKNMDEIERGSPRPTYKVDPMQVMLRRKLKTQKKVNSEFLTAERTDVITTNNQHLLRHLLEIGQGKAMKLPKETFATLQLTENIEKISRQSYHFQTKKEASRIDSENRKLMERIICSAGAVSTKQQLNASYQVHQQYKERHARKTSNEMAERLMEQSFRLKDSMMTSYMFPSIIDKESLMGLSTGFANQSIKTAGQDSRMSETKQSPTSAVKSPRPAQVIQKFANTQMSMFPKHQQPQNQQSPTHQAKPSSQVRTTHQQKSITPPPSIAVKPKPQAKPQQLQPVKAHTLPQHQPQNPPQQRDSLQKSLRDKHETSSDRLKITEQPSENSSFNRDDTHSNFLDEIQTQEHVISTRTQQAPTQNFRLREDQDLDLDQQADEEDDDDDLDEDVEETEQDQSESHVAVEVTETAQQVSSFPSNENDTPTEHTPTGTNLIGTEQYTSIDSKIPLTSSAQDDTQPAALGEDKPPAAAATVAVTSTEEEDDEEYDDDFN